MDRIELLERRLARLEKNNRGVKLLLALACAFAVLPFLTAATQKQKYVRAEVVSADYVSAKEFSFNDDWGESIPYHLKLMVHPNGVGGMGIYYSDHLLASLINGLDGTGLIVYNVKGKAVGALSALENGGSVQVLANDGKAAAELYATAGGGRMNVQSPEGRNAIVLNATPGGGELSLYGQKLRAIALGADSDGGLLRLLNKSGDTSVLLDSGNGGQVAVLNSQGKVAGGLGVNPRGDGSLVVNNKDGKVVGWLTILGDGSGGGFQLLDSGGVVVFHAP